jgi:hypothetical protein
MMSLEEFRLLADTWGGDVTRWPQAARHEAEALARTTEGAAILAEASELDRLAALAAPEVEAARAEAAIHAVVMRLAAADERPRRLSLTGLARWLMPAASFACAAAIGLYLGTAFPVGRQTTVADARAVLIMLLDNDSIGPDWITR